MTILTAGYGGGGGGDAVMMMVMLSAMARMPTVMLVVFLTTAGNDNGCGNDGSNNDDVMVVVMMAVIMQIAMVIAIVLRLCSPFFCATAESMVMAPRSPTDKPALQTSCARSMPTLSDARLPSVSSSTYPKFAFDLLAWHLDSKL